jgi:hypothetical protein
MGDMNIYKITEFIWFLIDGFFDSLRVKEAISFYIHDELDLLDKGARYGK